MKHPDCTCFPLCRIGLHIAPTLDNYVHDNGDAGIALLEVSDCEISHNYFKDNKYGIRLSVGCCDNFIYNNEFSDSSK